MFHLISTVIAVVLIAVDQIVKNWAEDVLTKGEIAVIEDVLYFKYAENTGVAFSMFSDNRWMLIGITSIMLIVVLAFFLSGKVTDEHDVFFVFDGVVKTPALVGSILPGITRDSVLQILRAEGKPVEECRISVILRIQ